MTLKHEMACISQNTDSTYYVPETKKDAYHGITAVLVLTTQFRFLNDNVKSQKYHAQPNATCDPV
ncbi:hypothetical protein LPTSP4_25430 [Leptospira ryugenii]|uniref:Uncharacterized protein n=1 Tax=Leptospira ryugenii TaxID=1917863 RepID=A0A2P2E287_9LEPT|nr:hypothetical protein LPTSP4_25430 [Leptospira ryugenii]